MIQLSKSSGYAIHALSCLGMAGADSCMIREVAQHVGIGSASLAKLVVQLTSHGLVTTRRGCRGGITLARPAETITLLQVIEAVENKEWIGACPFGLPYCPAHGQCPAHVPWNHLRGALQSIFANTTLADVIKATPPAKKHETTMSAISERDFALYVSPEATSSASLHR